eukprot:g19536.t1
MSVILGPYKYRHCMWPGQRLEINHMTQNLNGYGLVLVPGILNECLQMRIVLVNTMATSDSPEQHLEMEDYDTFDVDDIESIIKKLDFGASPEAETGLSMADDLPFLSSYSSSPPSPRAGDSPSPSSSPSSTSPAGGALPSQQAVSQTTFAAEEEEEQEEEDEEEEEEEEEVVCMQEGEAPSVETAASSEETGSTDIDSASAAALASTSLPASEGSAAASEAVASSGAVLMSQLAAPSGTSLLSSSRSPQSSGSSFSSKQEDSSFEFSPANKLAGVSSRSQAEADYSTGEDATADDSEPLVSSLYGPIPPLHKSSEELLEEAPAKQHGTASNVRAAAALGDPKSLLKGQAEAVKRMFEVDSPPVRSELFEAAALSTIRKVRTNEGKSGSAVKQLQEQSQKKKGQKGENAQLEKEKEQRGKVAKNEYAKSARKAPMEEQEGEDFMDLSSLSRRLALEFDEVGAKASSNHAQKKAKDSEKQDRRRSPNSESQGEGSIKKSMSPSVRGHGHRAAEIELEKEKVNVLEKSLMSDFESVTDKHRKQGAGKMFKENSRIENGQTVSM